MDKKIFILLNFLMPALVFAQTPYERLGQKAMMSGDFGEAATYFEKAYASDNSNTNALYLMGYAFYHDNNYQKSIDTFNKLIAYKPTESIAYYYRGKAKLLLNSQIKDYKSLEKEPLLLGAIKDFSTGIELSPSDMKLYQNRGLAYQEYGIFKSQKLNNIYNKNAATMAANASILDLRKVMADNSTRKDIAAQIEKSKQLLNNIK